VQGIEALARNGEEPRSLQEYHAATMSGVGSQP
jgi:hypothetical protein